MLNKYIYRTYRIVFTGSSEQSAVHLKRLLKLKCNIICILTKPSFSNNKSHDNPVIKLAIEYNIAYIQALYFNEDLFRFINSICSDVIIVVSYGLAVPNKIIRLPRFGCVNIHYSLLSRWRGSAPIQRAIYSGDNKTGVTIFQLNNGIDTGPILLNFPCKIGFNDNYISLSRKLELISLTLLRAFLIKLFSGNISFIVQNERLAIYANKVYKKEGLLSWCLPAFILERQARAFIYWPGNYLLYKSIRIKVLEAYVETKNNLLKPGLVLKINKRGIYLETGFGILVISKLQLEGKSVITANDYLNSNKKVVNIGAIVG